MQKQITFGFSSILLILILIVSWMFFQKFSSSDLAEQKLQTQKTATPFPSIKKAETFYISGSNDTPSFAKEVTIDPFTVREGERQSFSIWANDPEGIEKVRVIIYTDTREEALELTLKEGMPQEGRWEGAWQTKNISNSSTYATSFQALNKEGASTALNLFWNAIK